MFRWVIVHLLNNVVFLLLFFFFPVVIVGCERLCWLPAVRLFGTFRSVLLLASRPGVLQVCGVCALFVAASRACVEETFEC